jgi:hypothetical protein
MDCLIHYLICLLNAASTSSAALFHLQPCSAACHATRRRNLPTVLLPSLHVFPAFVVLCGNLFSSTASSPASLVFHLPGASMQPPSLLLPYPIYRRGELTILPQDEEFTCCYFYRPLLLSLYLLCNIIYLGCDFACDIYTKV